MDLCGDMLMKHSPSDFKLRSSVPRFQRLVGFLPSKMANNVDRWYNRWVIYPAHVKRLAKKAEFFHIVDHSYSHLAHFLPEGRVGIYCHDLDAFRCLLEPGKDPRPFWFRRMITRVFEGFKKARLVFCNTKATQKSVINLGIWRANDVVHVPLGVAEEFSPQGGKEKGEYLLHVGSCIARKRIDVLLRAFSEVCNEKKYQGLKLIQAGGSFSVEQKKQIMELKLESRVEQLQNLTREDLARLYRGTKCLVITSDAEGFGLPVIEGLSCGARVVASDIPALREVGEGNVCYFDTGNPNACAESILKSIETPSFLINGVASRWSWSHYANSIVKAYRDLELR